MFIVPELLEEHVSCNSLLTRFIGKIHAFKELFLLADARAIRNGGVACKDDKTELKEEFNGIYRQLNFLINDTEIFSEPQRRAIGNIAKRELLPYVLLSEAGELFYSKPKGYPGDYGTIEKIYNNSPRGINRLGPLLDECFLNLSAAQAVRNRREILAREIAKTVDASDGIANIISLACGPAREVIDAFSLANSKNMMNVTLLDFDAEALAFCKTNFDNRGFHERIEFLNENLIHLALGRKRLRIASQELAYSVGLIDYFNDDFVVKLLNFIFDILAKEGRVIVGNFHPANPTRAFLDYVLDWPLIHRTEDDMNRLFRSSKFSRPCTNIVFEDEKVNLFAECIKE